MSLNATLGDVARAAGVSIATASRTLSGKGGVGAPLRVRVEAAARRLGYVPHAAARMLAGGQGHVVGMLVERLTLPACEALEAMQQDLATIDCGVLFAKTAGDDSSAVQSLVRGGAQLLISIDLRRPLAGASKLRIPLLRFDSTGWAESADIRSVDGAAVASLAQRYLQGLGPKRLALIACEPEAALIRSYFRAACRRDVDVAIAAFSNVGEGCAAMRTLMKSPAALAVFCSDDVLAAGALRGCLLTGAEVPGAVAILGYGDTPVAVATTPALSSIRCGPRAGGRLLAHRVASLLGLETQPNTPPTVVPKVIERASTRPRCFT